MERNQIQTHTYLSSLTHSHTSPVDLADLNYNAPYYNQPADPNINDNLEFKHDCIELIIKEQELVNNLKVLSTLYHNLK